MSNQPTTILFLIALALIFAVKAVALVVILGTDLIRHIYSLSIRPTKAIDYSPIFENMELS